VQCCTRCGSKTPIPLESPPPHDGFCDISGFARYGYSDWRAGITMTMPFMSIYTQFPGDYRDRSRTLTDYEASKRAEAELRARMASGAMM
jgi:hypothetical protein